MLAHSLHPHIVSSAYACDEMQRKPLLQLLGVGALSSLICTAYSVHQQNASSLSKSPCGEINGGIGIFLATVSIYTDIPAILGAVATVRAVTVRAVTV